jgi:hypothetical protein
MSLADFCCAAVPFAEASNESAVAPAVTAPGAALPLEAATAFPAEDLTSCGSALAAVGGGGAADPRARLRLTT